MSSNLSTSQNPSNSLQQLRQLARQAISDQEMSEQHGSYDVKASLWALMSLRRCIDHEVLEGEPREYAERLLARMQAFQQDYHSDTFIDEYGGARASMGSAIHAFAARAERLLSGDRGDEAATADAVGCEGPENSAVGPSQGKPRRYRWVWVVWFLLMLGYLLAH